MGFFVLFSTSTIEEISWAQVQSRRWYLISGKFEFAVVLGIGVRRIEYTRQTHDKWACFCFFSFWVKEASVRSWNNLRNGDKVLRQRELTVCNFAGAWLAWATIFWNIPGSVSTFEVTAPPWVEHISAYIWVLSSSENIGGRGAVVQECCVAQLSVPVRNTV